MPTTAQAGGSLPRGSDRRHSRHRVSSLEYIELGAGNGGIVLNIGEGGMAVTAALPLTSLELPNIRFRLPGSDQWIEASAQVAWTATSRKEAGIQFIQLKPDDRDRIKFWVASKTTPKPTVTAAQPLLGKEPEPTKNGNSSVPDTFEPKGSPARVDAPVASTLAPHQTEITEIEAVSIAQAGSSNAAEPQSAPPFIPPVASTAQPTQPEPEPAEAANASLPKSSEPQSAAAAPHNNQAGSWPSTVPAVSAPLSASAALNGDDAPAHPPLIPQIPIDTSPRGWAVLEYHEDHPAETFGESAVRSSVWLKTILLVAAVAIISFAVGTAAGSSLWNGIVGLVSGHSGTGQSSSIQSSNSAVPGNPVEQTPPPPRGAFNNTQQYSGTPQNAAPRLPGAEETTSPSSSQLNKNEVLPSSPPPPGSFDSHARGSYKPHAAERLPEEEINYSENDRPAATAHLPGADPPPDSAATSVPRVSAVPAAPPVEATTLPRGTSAIPVDANESSSPVSNSRDSLGNTGSVEVISNPYPSPRLPLAILSQSRSKTNLQIGPVISRVEPIYPPEALRQHLEGTVKLHIIVGINGAVDRVELKSGPILLANAARNALQQWRYKQSLLRSVPVESEEDITVVFRMSRPANSSK